MMVTKQLEDKPIRALWFLFQTCVIHVLLKRWILFMLNSIFYSVYCIIYLFYLNQIEKKKSQKSLYLTIQLHIYRHLKHLKTCLLACTVISLVTQYAEWLSLAVSFTRRLCGCNLTEKCALIECHNQKLPLSWGKKAQFHINVSDPFMTVLFKQ